VECRDGGGEETEGDGHGEKEGWLASSFESARLVMVVPKYVDLVRCARIALKSLLSRLFRLRSCKKLPTTRFSIMYRALLFLLSSASLLPALSWCHLLLDLTGV
jgi:hypothetical protein